VSWIAPGRAGSFEEVFGLCPELFAAWQRFAALFAERQLVPPVILELCRLRVAQLLGCRAELARRAPEALAAGLDEERVVALAEFETSPRFDAAERACLRFASKWVFDVHGITDEEAAAVVAALGEPGTVALAEALAIFDGFCRFRLMLGIGDGGDGAGGPS
jgi:alkylhydroperoxidase family enzyme